MSLKLGDKVKDTVTGFTGIIIARHEYLNGCIRLSVQPDKLKDAKPIEALTFDIEQIALIKAGQHKQLARTGGPEKEPARASVPSR